MSTEGVKLESSLGDISTVFHDELASFQLASSDKSVADDLAEALKKRKSELISSLW